MLMSFISKVDLAGCNVVVCFKQVFNMWNSLENVACAQQERKRGRWKGDGGENEEKARMTPELAQPPASQSLQQHEYQSGAAERRDQMKTGEEEREQGLWGNDEAVKGNNCRCIFFFFFFQSSTASGDASEQSLWDTWAELRESCLVRALIKIFLQPSWDTRRKHAVCESLV